MDSDLPQPRRPLRKALRARPIAVIRARDLRKRMTMPERILWSHLRAGQIEGLKFRRQHPLGSYIADFYCDAAAAVIEVDGFTSHSYMLHERDAVRTLWLEKRDVLVLRVTASWVTRDADAATAWIKRNILARLAELGSK